MLSIFLPWFSVMCVVTGMKPDRSSLCKRKEMHQWASVHTESPGWGGKGPLFTVFCPFFGNDPLWEANVYSLHVSRDKLDGSDSHVVSLEAGLMDSHCVGETHQVRVMFLMQEN